MLPTDLRSEVLDLNYISLVDANLSERLVVISQSSLVERSQPLPVNAHLHKPIHYQLIVLPPHPREAG